MAEVLRRRLRYEIEDDFGRSPVLVFDASPFGNGRRRRQQFHARSRVHVRGRDVRQGGRCQALLGVDVVMNIRIVTDRTLVWGDRHRRVLVLFVAAGGGTGGLAGGRRGGRVVGVIPDVRFHALLRVEGVVADRALVHLLAVMGDLVELEHVVVTEGFAADLARVGFLPGVRSRMHLQLFRACEALLAHVADVRLFSRVRSHVDDQLSRLDECL